MNPILLNSLLIILKVLSLVGLFIYAIFATILVRQEMLMANVLEEEFEPFLRLVVYLHLASAIGIFVLAVFVLP